jgi:hypothetical protein
LEEKLEVRSETSLKIMYTVSLAKKELQTKILSKNLGEKGKKL